jgi:surface protein
MKCVFDDCRSLLELNVSTWNTSNVKYMDAVFSDLLLVKNLDVSKWDTSNVVSMAYMFDGYDFGSSLKSIDLSSWDTSKLEDISEMFLNINLEKLNITGWNLSNIDVKDNVFKYADKLNYVICSNIETLNVLADLLPSRTSTSMGTIEFKGDKTGINLSDFTDKNWNVI